MRSQEERLISTSFTARSLARARSGANIEARKGRIRVRAYRGVSLWCGTFARMSGIELACDRPYQPTLEVRVCVHR
jgi:hypothetical protein